MARSPVLGVVSKVASSACRKPKDGRASEEQCDAGSKKEEAATRHYLAMLSWSCWYTRLLCKDAGREFVGSVAATSAVVLDLAGAAFYIARRYIQISLLSRLLLVSRVKLQRRKSSTKKRAKRTLAVDGQSHGDKYSAAARTMEKAQSNPNEKESVPAASPGT